MECFYEKTFKNIEELKFVIKEYIYYYSEEKIQLNGLNHVQYKVQSLKAHSIFGLDVEDQT